MFLPWIISIVVIGALGLLFYYWRASNRKEVIELLSKSLFLVKIPKDSSGDGYSFQKELSKFEEFLSSLSNLKRGLALELAVPHMGEEIHFFVSPSRNDEETVMKQIQGIWNGAVVERVGDDYNIFAPNSSVAGAYLLQKENFGLPIRSYKDLELDSFEAVAAGFSKMQEIGEGAALQIILIPTRSNIKKAIEFNIQNLKKGGSLNELSSSSPFSIKNFLEVFLTQDKKKEEKENNIDQDSIDAFSKKIEKPIFEANVRIVTSGPSQKKAEEILDGILGGFEQFSSPKKNEFKIVRSKSPQKLAYEFIFRNFSAKQSMFLSTEEIASFYHFPIPSTGASRVKWLKSKEANPPPDLPKSGTLLGTSNFRGERKDVFMTDADRMRHVYVIGQTGTGKTTFLGNMIIEDIKHGKGVALIDPHGEFAEKVLSHIPPEREKDLIYFDPADMWRPLGLNMLDYNRNRPEEKTFIVNEMQSIFNKLFSEESMGPMFEQYMRNALLLLMEDMDNEPATLIEVPRVFTDPEWRKAKLSRITNPVIVDFWEKEAAKAGGEASLANMTPYITSKFNNFISNDYMRPIIGQTKSSFQFRNVLDEGKILIVNLSKGRIGDINANLLGMIFTGKLLMAALSRVDIADESKRREFNLYIDEFQNFTTDSISTIFSEARKYRLSLTVAHQFMAQLTDAIRDSVFGNVGSQIVFRVGPKDAEFLVKQFEPIFSENDLINIDNLNAYVKLLINGKTSQPFNIQVPTTAWRGGGSDTERLKKICREKFGMDRQDVESQILKRLRS